MINEGQSAMDSKTNGESQRKPALAPSISLPKGGGAVNCIGEKFAANPLTGTASMSVPITTSPGRSGFGPQLSLSYDSGSGNGLFGIGWSLSLPSITRKTDKGLPKYQDAMASDVFILSGAEDLVPVLTKNGSNWVHENLPIRNVNGANYRIQRFRPRIEGLFARIERWTRISDGDSHWRSISKNNITTLYGATAASRIADPSDSTIIFSWLVCESHDDKGNAIRYEYKAENSQGIDLSSAHERNRSDITRAANRHLKRIKYGNRTPRQTNEDLSLRNDWMFEVVFDYGDHDADIPEPSDNSNPWTVRNDPFSTYRACFEVRTYRLCHRVLMFHHFPNESEVGAGCLVRSTDFSYFHEQNPDDGGNPIYSFIRAVTETGYKRKPLMVPGYLKSSPPPVEFTYTKATIQSEIREVDPASLENLPAGLDGTSYQWVDLDGEGLSGILTEQAGGWFYKRNLSPINVVGQNSFAHIEARFAPVELVATKPASGLSSGHAQFMDLAGDGQLDLVTLHGPTPGFYERNCNEGWDPFTTFDSLPVVNWDDPNLKFVDLTGDGHADLLITEDNVFSWHPSLAESGFGERKTTRQSLDDEEGPRLVFADGTQSIYLADISGDGLTDLVRIRNGEVCYWPNLGYGRFGAKVTMDNSPWFDCPDQFDQHRIRLADVDGSGLTDIIYLHGDGVRIYFNQSGNSWSQVPSAPAFPRIDSQTSVTVVDLLGNGTACLVWSSPLPGDSRRPMQYIDLMGGQKPHLLVKTVNNLGAETVVHYAPSTQFYLQDKYAGNPWITKLPFPVHVVERVETYDRISRNHFVTRYAYHHGYFDGVEREFRGFGMVEQWDTEEFAALTGDGTLPAPTNVDAASHVPPVHTKTWFHTGVYVDGNHISNFFAGLLDGNDPGEYYREPGLDDQMASALLLDDTVLPNGLSVEEEREACRTLKGSILRQEIYAQDGTPKAQHPYSVSERNYTLKQLQPRDSNPYAVFFAHPRETIDYHYDRNPTDPRTTHALTLEVDDFGNVLKSATIGYGRRAPDLSLPLQADRDKQTKTLITYAESSFTNPIDDGAVFPDSYRTPLPCETRTYELTGYAPTNATRRFQITDFVQTTGNVLTHIFDNEIAYEDQPTNGKQRRIIEHDRTLYRADDLTALLLLGLVEPLALPGESYKLAFTHGLLAQVFQRNGQPLMSNPVNVLDGQAADQGGYLQGQELKADGRFPNSDPDDDWWIPTGRVLLSPNSNDTSALELTYAQSHFFLPHRTRDPFHTNAVSTESFITYDAYDLLMLETRDALGNRVTVGERDASDNLTISGNDYRVLQPSLVMDHNRNRTTVAFDVLGKVVGTAVMGKPAPAAVEGDSLDSFEADLPEATILDHLANPLANPQAILGRGTTRLVYDLFAYYRTQGQPDPQPAVVYTLARETHDSDPVPASGLKFQHGFSYSDGFGREMQKKIQAEPGPAPQRDQNREIMVDQDGALQLTPNDVSPRWMGNSWTVFNNKGKPVRQYEPFFTDTHHFEFDVRIGVSPVLFYDPLERVVATLHPNHSWEKVNFDAWRQETWDVNDTVLVADPKTDADVGDFFARLPNADYLPTWHDQRQNAQLGPREQAAASKAAAHAATPTTAHFDTLGRPFLTIADNGTQGQYQTRVGLDIEGNQRSVTDALGRVVMRYDYSIAGPEKGKEAASRIHQVSMDAGQRWMLHNVVGNPLRSWDERNHEFQYSHDVLHRPALSKVLGGDGATPLDHVIDRVEYGESQATPELSNLRGHIYRRYDTGGLLEMSAYDFKGKPASTTRRLFSKYKEAANWIGANLANDLEAASFTFATETDALGRISRQTAPDGSVISPSYNVTGLLNSETVIHTSPAITATYLQEIDYNVKGQRERIHYGNGVVSRFYYEKETFRLNRIESRQQNNVLQDLYYTHDPVGNITSIEDQAIPISFFANAQIEPLSEYVYDALYRLTEASGRENTAPLAFDGGDNWNDAAFIQQNVQGDPLAVRNYLQRYQYDEVGNIKQMKHVATGNNWTRDYAYATASNRLINTQVGANTYLYPHHAQHGYITAMPHLQDMGWNFKEEIAKTIRQRRTDGGTPETTYYQYDGQGQRIRKITENTADPTISPTKKEERIYIAGYETYLTYQANTVNFERESLSLLDEGHRFVMVETVTQNTDPAAPPSEIIGSRLTRYQLHNHLGSAALELDATANVISYEEYHPYGTTAYQAKNAAIKSSAKRYRFIGMERDEETSLEYHSARYYLPWLGRWCSADPIGIGDGVNVYCYAGNNPIVKSDRNGKQAGDGEDESSTPKWSITIGNNLSTPAQQKSNLNHPTLIFSSNQVFYNTNIKHPFGIPGLPKIPILGENDVTEGDTWAQVLHQFGKTNFQFGATLYKEKTDANASGLRYEAPTNIQATFSKLFRLKDNSKSDHKKLGVNLSFGISLGMVVGIPIINDVKLYSMYRPVGTSSGVFAKLDFNFLKGMVLFLGLTGTHVKMKNQQTQGSSYDSIGLKGGFGLYIHERKSKKPASQGVRLSPE